MDLSEFEWVDDKEWEALEEAMTAAVQQREAQRRHGIANSSFENAKAGSQASFLEPSPVFERSKVDWASVQVTRAPPCSVVEGHSAEPSQPEWPEAMSLSEWVPSQRGFPGFWPECTTAGAESLTAGKPIVSAGENCAAAEEGHVRTDTDCATAVMEQLQNRRGGELGSVPQEPSGLSPSGRTNGPESKATHLEEMAGTAPLPAPATESFETVKPLPEPSLSVQPPLKVCTSTASPSEPPNTSGDQTVPDCGQGERHSARQLPAWLTPARAAAPPQDCTLPIMRFGGRIVYAVSPQEVECTARTMLEDLRGGEACLGFDIEWKVTFRRGEAPQKAALIQLCPSGACCYLFHIARSGLTSSLRALLEEQSIGKAGAGIYGDAQKLRRDFGISMGGLRDLSDLANERLQPRDGPRKWSLTALAQEAMLQQVEKPPKQRISDWERLPLSPDQRQYAATDAYASLRLYQVLMSLPAPPPRPILRPLPQSELNSLANPGLNPGAQPAQELWIPAVSEPSYLAPSKMDVHRLHVDGLSIEEIAVKKGVRLTTVESYLVEAMQAGLAYPWHRLGVSDAVRERVEGAVSAELELVGEGEVERQVEAQGSVESRSSENGGQPKRVRGALTGIPVKCGEPSRGSEERGFLQSGGIERTTADVGSIREVAAQRSRVSGRLNGDVRNGAGPSTVQEQTAFLPPEDGANSSGCISQEGRRAGRSFDELSVTSAKGVVADRLSGLRLKAVMDRIPPEQSVTFSQVRMVVAHLARRADADEREKKRLRLLNST